jgi:hypothetical protein
MTLHELTTHLGNPTQLSTADHWLMDLDASSDEPLERQLERATAELESLNDRLLELGPGAEITFLISWSPKQGQDGLALGPRLLGTLGRLQATVLVDTYSDY